MWSDVYVKDVWRSFKIAKDEPRPFFSRTRHDNVSVCVWNGTTSVGRFFLLCLISWVKGADNMNQWMSKLYIKKVGFTFHKPPISLTNCAWTCLKLSEIFLKVHQYVYVWLDQTISVCKMPAQLMLLTETTMELAKAFHKKLSDQRGNFLNSQHDPTCTVFVIIKHD